jgi:hypothetical protein
MHYRKWYMFIVLALGLHSTAYGQENNEVFRVGNWTGVRYLDPSGHIDRCSAVAQYGDDIVLALTLWADKTIGVKISKIGWTLQKPSYELALAVDYVYIGSVVGDRETPYKLSIMLGGDQEILQLLSRGNHLYILNSDLGAFDFPLVKSSAALSEVSRCASPDWTPRPAVIESPGPPVNVIVVSPEGLPAAPNTPRQVIVQQKLNADFNPRAFGLR